MIRQKVYTRAHDAQKLAEAFRDAGRRPTDIASGNGTGTPDRFVITWDDALDSEAQIDAVALNGTVSGQTATQQEAQGCLGDVRTQYQAMITRLEQIEAATSPTNAQVIQAVRDLATYEKRILKALRLLVLG